MFGALYFGQSYFSEAEDTIEVFPPPGITGLVAPTQAVGIVSS